MISLDFDHADFHSLLKDLAARLGTVMHKDVLRVPPALGKGYLRAIRLPNGLSVMVTNMSMDVDVKLHRLKKMPAFYILAFDEIFIRTRLEHKIDNEKVSINPPIYSVAALHSTLFDTTVIATRGCIISSVRIIFDHRWLARYFGIDKEDELLVKYISLKSKKLTLEPLDTDYRMYIEEIYNTDVEDPLYYTILENRVMLLIERFMNRIMDKMDEAELKNLKPDDVFRMMEVEAELTKDNVMEPPTVQELSQQFGISQTRLKTMFKEVYGYPIYEYFQRFRMEKARAMLLSGEHSVKETGYQLGYKSLSNFAKAFRQIFEYAPSDIIKALKNV
ncbi:MAG TPA: AraC family transcriptional regulator [Chitinophagaceae bacterium]|nr:AraC family transcriptional regulator [Chitinophagaceae bacterium]